MKIPGAPKEAVEIKLLKRIVTASIIGAALLLPSSIQAAANRKTQNVILITFDGLRWQEVFTGAQEALISKEHGGVGNTNALRKAFWRETPEARREALLPFFWNVV